MRLYLLHRNQSAVADLLGRKQQQVQSTLKSCGWEIIEEAERQVKQMGVDYLQGFHIQKPMPLDNLLEESLRPSLVV